MQRLPLFPLAEGLQCMACGPQTPHGMRLQFFLVGDHVEADWTVTSTTEGWPGLLHGGAFAILHDEAAAWAMIGLTGRLGVTRTMQLRYHRALHVGDSVQLVGRVQRTSQESVQLSSEVRLKDGRIASTAQTEYVFLSQPGLEAILGRPLPPRIGQWMSSDKPRRDALLSEWAAADAAPSSTKPPEGP